ncbi:MAG: hypothetical protein HY237_06090 [Acidobacteria bacterium]|nr:hypothetical protein [Acidobacteriota bacterium]
MEEHNRLVGDVEALTGLYDVMPRYQISSPVVHQGAVNFHNIKIEGSVVGAINTGHVRQIDVALSHIKATGTPELAKALADFTTAVAHSTELPNETKNEILEQLATIAKQAATPKESRSWAVLKALVTSIGTQIATTGLAELWEKIKPLLGL